MQNLIINFTPTGMIPTKEMTPYVPITPKEIIEEVKQACEIGITIVHLHARDENGKPTYKKDIYAEIIEGIREFDKELVICVSLSGRDFNELEKRSEVLELTGNLKPDMGSLTLSSLNFPQQASINSPKMVQDLAMIMMEKEIVPELEAFDVGMINYAKYLIKKRILLGPQYINLLVGNIAGAQLDPIHIGSMIKDLPEGTYWSLAGIGSTQLAANTIGISLGGGVRVGLEDNIHLDSKRTKLATNSELLLRLKVIANMHERKIMTPSEFRSSGVMKMHGGHGSYGG